MKGYFQLQSKLLNRNIRESGLHPMIAYLVTPPLFCLLSNFLFEKITLAVYLYGLIALGIVTTLSEGKRNDFLKSIFNRPQYLKLRMIENLIVALPFVAFMLYSWYPLEAFVLIGSAISLTSFNFNNTWSIVLPTPFGKRPFEFVVGFRKTMLIFPIAYGLTYAAVSVGNFSLGAFSLVVIALTCLTYYSTTEAAYFVWIYRLKPKAFLWLKIRAALLNFLLLGAPIIIALCIVFWEQAVIIVVLLLLCCLYLICIILGKYAAIPKQINFIQGFVIGLSFIFPPLLIAVIPYFYKRAITQLNTLLS